MDVRRGSLLHRRRPVARPPCQRRVRRNRAHREAGKVPTTLVSPRAVPRRSKSRSQTEPARSDCPSWIRKLSSASAAETLEAELTQRGLQGRQLGGCRTTKRRSHRAAIETKSCHESLEVRNRRASGAHRCINHADCRLLPFLRPLLIAAGERADEVEVERRGEVVRAA